MKRTTSMLKILVILIIILLVIVGFYKLFTKEKQSNDISYIETLQDGTKRNTCEKLKEIKTINGIELSNIELIEKSDGTIEMSATAKNIITEKIDTYMLQINLLSQDNQIIGNAYMSVMNLDPNDTLEINGMIEKVDISKVYNAEIIKLDSVT